jgi:anti-sigma B factor antagonist
MNTPDTFSPVLQPAGRFDAHTTGPVLGWLAAARAAGQAELVLDLEAVTFIDSSALAVLVKGMKQCREQGGDLHLCSLREPVRIIFELTRLDRALSLFADQAAAVAAFAGRERSDDGG